MKNLLNSWRDPHAVVALMLSAVEQGALPRSRIRENSEAGGVFCPNSHESGYNEFSEV